MSATNQKALSVYPGILEVAVNPGTIPALASDFSNAAAIRTACDALSFTRLASIIDLKVNNNLGDNIVEVNTDDNGTIYKSVRPTVTVTGNWYEVGEVAAVSLITGQGTLSIAASPVTVTAEAHGTGWTIGKPIKANFKNGANTIVTSIVVKSGVTTLTAVTDYQTYVGDGVNGTLGYTYIVPVTVQAGAITFGYSYTPNAAQYSGGTVKSATAPSLVVRITSTNTSGKIKEHYFVDAAFTGELVEGFVDVVRAGDLPNSPFTFQTNKNGMFIRYTDDV